MSSHKPIRRIAIVGTGVIGANWAACYLSRGLDVVATDPAPDAEANLRRSVEGSWELLSAYVSLSSRRNQSSRYCQPHSSSEEGPRPESLDR
jgi:3-hydroxyacyl-CoA dehydrogenase